jgi:hypothetical protein
MHQPLPLPFGTIIIIESFEWFDAAFIISWFATFSLYLDMISTLILIGVIDTDRGYIT